jgi:BirA family biotin operon repressor/biotin-[acetyl-CoA-carboxylase] ligase
LPRSLRPPLLTVNARRIVSEKLVASVEHHERLESTNDRAKQIARQEKPPLPLLVVADQQLSGRGRGARRWWTGKESLAFSLLVSLEHWTTGRARVPVTALAAGVALVEVLAPRLAPRTVGLEWPNDVCVEGRKLAGILVEAPTANRLVIGIGVNTNSRLRDAPAELQDRIATLFDLTAACHDHTDLLAGWLQCWNHWFGCLPGQADLVTEAADRLCLQRGQHLRLRRGAEVHEGTCRGIAADGALILETAEGLRNYYSGTLH